jgi:hypothetical protein
MPALRARAGQVLQAVAKGAGGPGIVLSPLADGADQLVAREAVDQGYQLIAPLPFGRDEYERDFVEAAQLAAYRELLAKASLMTELDGDRSTDDSAEHAYAAAGRWLVDSSHVLIAIWNGRAARGKGGTAEVVGLARAAGVPVIWIKALPPHSVEIMEPETALTTRVRAVLDSVQRRFGQSATPNVLRQ